MKADNTEENEFVADWYIFSEGFSFILSFEIGVVCKQFVIQFNLFGLKFGRALH
jgi:hypothetical protein